MQGNDDQFVHVFHTLASTSRLIRERMQEVAVLIKELTDQAHQETTTLAAHEARLLALEHPQSPKRRGKAQLAPVTKPVRKNEPVDDMRRAG